MGHQCRSYSVLPVTNHLLLSPASPRSSLSVPADLPTSEGASLSVGTSLLLQLPSRGAGPVPFPLFFFSFFHPIRLHRDSYCPFRFLRSSASVQQVLYGAVPFVDVFLMYLWGEVNSSSSYSAIFLFPIFLGLSLTIIFSKYFSNLCIWICQ